MDRRLVLLFIAIGTLVGGYIVYGRGGRNSSAWKLFARTNIKWQRLTIVDDRWHFADFPGLSVHVPDLHWQPTNGAKWGTGVAYLSWPKAGGIIEITSSKDSPETILRTAMENANGGVLIGPQRRTRVQSRLEEDLVGPFHVASCKVEFSFRVPPWKSKLSEMKSASSVVYQTFVTIPARNRTFLFQLDARWSGPTLEPALANETEEAKKARVALLEREFLALVRSFRDDQAPSIR